MNRGVLEKALRETWLPTLVFGLGLAGIETLLALILPDVFARSGNMLQLKFVQTILRALLGTQVGETMGPEMVLSMAWVHPVVFALLWGHVIVLCTRLPAAEVESGTIDVLLSWPVARGRVLLAHTVVWLAAGTLLLGVALLANVTASCAVEAQFRAPPDVLLKILANLWCLYVAVGGLTCCCSALASHRGRAVGAAFGLLLAGFLLNFLVQFWPLAEKIAFLSVLNYYRPLNIFQHSAWPVGDMLVLLGVGLGCWLIGAAIFARRSICTA